MKLDKIELDLCVNVVPYPHEEIEALNCAVKAHEEQRQKYYKLWCNSLDDLHQERLLTNETLMTAQHWKKQYEELLVKHAKVLEENVKYEKKAGADSDNFLDLLAQHTKLQDKHTALLEENNKRVDIMYTFENAPTFEGFIFEDGFTTVYK